MAQIKTKLKKKKKNIFKTHVFIYRTILYDIYAHTIRYVSHIVRY